MARSNAASELKKLVVELQKERQQHVDSITVIDATFGELGISAAPAKRGPGRPRKTKAAAAKPAPKAAPKTGRTRRRGRFGISGEESVTNFIKANRHCRTGQINAHWIKEGRRGKADNALGKLVKEGKLVRTPLKGERGSTYRVK